MEGTGRCLNTGQKEGHFSVAHRAATSVWQKSESLIVVL